MKKSYKLGESSKTEKGISYEEYSKKYNPEENPYMEFLETYGWSILVIMAAIGTLAYFGILSPNNLLPHHSLENTTQENISPITVCICNTSVNNHNTEINITMRGIIS
jgi:hypothetical protein